MRLSSITSAASLALALTLVGCEKSTTTTVMQNGPAPFDGVATPTPVPTPTGVPTRAPDAYQDMQFERNTTLSASAGTTFSAQNLPSGLVIDPATGTISGFPEEGGLFDTVTVTATKAGEPDRHEGPISFLIAGDPLVMQAWHMHNTGQSTYAKLSGTSGEDMKIRATIRSGVTGNGVKVVVSDTGAEIAHEDLAPNILLSASKNYSLPPPYFGDPGVTPRKNDGTSEDHGTMVSGIIGAAGWNGVGSRGVAPKAKIAVYNYILSNQTLDIAIDQTKGDADIFNYSYCSFDDAPIPDMGPNDPGEAEYLAAIENGVKTGRGGKGNIYIKAACNDWFVMKESPTTLQPNGPLVFRSVPSFTDPDNRSPFIMVVGAVNANGTKSSYSSMGSNLWVSAAGGEFGYDQAANQFHGPFLANSFLLMPAILTTDRSSCDTGAAARPKTGDFQYNAFEFPASTSNAACNYTSTMNGTSAAAPSATGAVALMLEANPALTWRDVRHILAQTATKVDAARTPSSNLPWAIKGAPGTFPFSWDTASQLSPAWVTNAAGYHFHNWYGFGRIDVDAAVKAAKLYSQNLGTLTALPPQESAANKSFADYNAGTHTLGVATDKITVVSTKTIDAVVVRTHIEHESIGDVGIELTSPSGTTSILLWVYNSWTQPLSVLAFQGGNWIPQGAFGLDYSSSFLSNAFYGETANGDWTLKVVDGYSNTKSGSLKNWRLELFVH